MTLAAGCVLFRPPPAPADVPGVGSCVQLRTSSPSSARTADIDCADQQALYVITEVGGGDLTCDPAEARYVQAVPSGESRTVCLRPSLRIGDCYLEDRSTARAAKFPCTTAPRKAVRLLAVLTGTTDRRRCPALTSSSLAVPRRDLIYCFAALA